MTRSFDPRPLADVRVEDGQRPTLVFVRRLRHTPDLVWRALVDPGQLPEWAPYTAGRSLDELGPVTFTMIDGAEKVEFNGRVRVAQPPRVLEYTMAEDVVRWELEPTPEGTQLTLRQSVESLSWLPKVAAGWHICLAVAEHLIDGDPIGPITGQDALEHGWPQLHDRYAAELGVASDVL